jgi:hypothetical protein
VGKRARLRRKHVKNELRREVPEGWKENEFGELQKKVSKTEARRRILHAWYSTHFENTILQMMCKAAIDDIHAQADANFLAAIGCAVQFLEGHSDP